MVSLICFFIASMLWAVMNTWTFHFSGSIFYGKPDRSFWGVDSWLRKYHPSAVDAPRTWYYRLFKIDLKEAFPGSATIFVWVTDGYHLTQFFFLWAITISVATCPMDWPMEWGAVIGRALLMRAVWWVGFNLIFTWLKKR